MRVLLANDRLDVRSALRLLLTQEPEIDVVGETSEAQDLLNQAEIVQPDLVLLDWELPGSPAVELLIALRAHCVRVKVIVLSERPEARQRALAAGIDAFVSKGDPPEELLSVLHALGEGMFQSSLTVWEKGEQEGVPPS